MKPAPPTIRPDQTSPRARLSRERRALAAANRAFAPRQRGWWACLLARIGWRS